MTEADKIALLALDIDGVLTDGRVLYAQDGREQKLLSFRDIDAVSEAARRGLKLALITGEDNDWVEAVSRRLKVAHVVRGAKDKLAAVRGLSEKLDVPLEAICYVGDSDRDAPALAAVGLGVAPADATAPAKAAAHLVLKSGGGRGAIREVLEHVLKQAPPPKQEKDSQATATLDSARAVGYIKDIVEESIAIQRRVGEQLAPSIVKAAEIMLSSLRDGHKLLIFGNGGSAADAQHLAAELVGRFEQERKAVPALALTTDTSILTAIANDYGYETVFARQIEALGRAGDIAVAISTSGDSPSVLEGVRTAEKKGIKTIGLTGQKGGALAKLADLCLQAPSSSTARIQEAHALIIHLLCGLVEANLRYNL